MTSSVNIEIWGGVESICRWVYTYSDQLTRNSHCNQPEDPNQLSRLWA
jgi:hypothetical protein